jgi:hypothetical protein
LLVLLVVLRPRRAVESSKTSLPPRQLQPLHRAARQTRLWVFRLPIR